MALWRFGLWRMANGYRGGRAAGALCASRPGFRGAEGRSGAVGRPVRAAEPEAARRFASGGCPVAEAASGRGPGGRAGDAGGGKAYAGRDRQGGRATRAFGLPGGADRADRHRPQHSRHPRSRRLRRRRPGAARGHCVAGQAPCRGDAAGDLALLDGLGHRRLDTRRRDEPRRWPRHRA